VAQQATSTASTASTARKLGAKSRGDLLVNVEWPCRFVARLGGSEAVLAVADAVLDVRLWWP
jgi:hypothetical protein